MIKMALHLLKLEKKSAVDLCICIASTVTVCLLFMEILKSPEISGNLDFLNIQFLYNALLTFFMIFMCVVLMVYLSNYFIRLKSREMGLIVLSGLSFFKRTIYSLVQVLCIVLFSSMIGIIVFLGISPIVKMVIYEILSVDANIFVLSFDALMQGLAVILAMILVIMLFNSGFIMRTGITELLENHNIISYKKDTRAIKPPDGIYPLIYIFGLICMYTGNNQVGGYILFSFFGAVGAYGVFRHYLPHHYNRNALKYCKTAKDLLIKEDVSLIMQQSKSFILILMVAMIGIVPFICGSTDNSLFNFEMHLAFVITNILLSLTLINRFKIDHIQRREHFHAIYQLGFARAEIDFVYMQEIKYYFRHLWILSIIYIFNIFIVFYFNQGMGIMTTFIIMAEYLIPYMLAEMIILYERKEEIKNDKYYA